MTYPISRQEFLDFWHVPEGTPEADLLWSEKVAMMQGRRLRDAPMIFVKADVHYQSPIDGRVIRSEHERRDDLARNGCIPYDPGMRQDNERRVIDEERSLDRSVDEFVEREYETMPSAKRERLANEMADGMTAEPVRLTANGG